MTLLTSKEDFDALSADLDAVSAAFSDAKTRLVEKTLETLLDLIYDEVQGLLTAEGRAWVEAKEKSDENFDIFDDLNKFYNGETKNENAG